MKCFVSFAYFSADGAQGYGNGIVPLPGRSLSTKDVRGIAAWADDLVAENPETYGTGATAVVLNMVVLTESLF